MLRPLVMALAIGCALPAQTAAIRAVFAADARGEGPPALVWLRRELLSQQPGWPAGLDPLQQLRVEATASGCVFAASALPLRGYLDGEFVLPGVGSVLLSCDQNGLEDWFAPAAGELPASIEAVRQRLGEVMAPMPRSVDAAAFCGSIAGGLVDADPRQLLLTLGMRRCGEVTFQCWRQPDGLRVRGRSDGGLLLPALGAFLAGLPDLRELQQHWQDGGLYGRDALSVRAFASRDGDRAEAARQLARTPSPAAQATLRALLYSDDPCRLSAMDSLRRHRDPEQLVRLVAAADPRLPQSLDLARDAIAELWPLLSESQQQLTRQRIDAVAPAMRSYLPAAAAVAADRRGAMIAMLAVLMFSLFGFWLRERMRLGADGAD